MNQYECVCYEILHFFSSAGKTYFRTTLRRRNVRKLCYLWKATAKIAASGSSNTEVKKNRFGNYELCCAGFVLFIA